VSEKPKIQLIRMNDGERLVGITLETEAPLVPGFIAIQSKTEEDSTEYISLSAIKSIQMSNKELHQTSPGYYFTPAMTVKVRN